MNKLQHSIIVLLVFTHAFIPYQTALAISDALALAPKAMTHQSGSAQGNLSALNVRDQSWDANTPANYVLFTTPGVRYSGYRTYRLVAGIAPASVTAIRIEANYFGPGRGAQAWTWSLYDWSAKTWVAVGDNTGVPAWEWHVLIFKPANPARFISSNGSLRLRLASNNATYNARLDYEAIHVLYTPTTPPTPATGKIPAPPAGYLYHGVYPGGVTGEEDDLTLANLSAYETAAGKSAAWVFFSHNWYHGRAFPKSTAAWIRDAGHTPYIRLMLRNDTTGSHAELVYTLKRILSGYFDNDLRGWCAGARDFGTPLLAEYGTEVNGSWFPWNGIWSGGGTKDGYGDPTLADGPERFRDAYRRIIRLCRSEGARNITWVFHVNDGDYPNVAWNHFENYYPGDAWIDWLAVSVYGAQTPLDDYWPIFRDSLDAVYPRLAALSATKPIILAEFGVTAGNSLGQQDVWARDALTDITAFRYPRLVGFSWWNEWWQNDENPAHDTDMRLETNPLLAQVFQDLIGSNPIVLGAIP